MNTSWPDIVPEADAALALAMESATTMMVDITSVDMEGVVQEHPVGGADHDIRQNAESRGIALRAPKAFEMPSSVQAFLRIQFPHLESDLRVVCRRLSDGAPVTFYVHCAVLAAKCAFFNDQGHFVSLCQRTSVAESGVDTVLPAIFQLEEYDDDIVYEVLRFIYCGSLCPPHGFHRRFPQLLSLVDFLGVLEMAERNTGLASIFGDPAIIDWLSTMPPDRLHSLLSECRVFGSPTNGSCALGFRLRRSLIMKLLELRPGDLTVDALGEDLHRRVVNVGSPKSEGPVDRLRVLLPGPVIFVALVGGQCERVHLGGGDTLGGAQGRHHWHDGRLLRAQTSREQLLLEASAGAQAPHQTLVIFVEGQAGAEATRHSFQRAAARPDGTSGFVESAEAVLAAANAVHGPWEGPKWPRPPLAASFACGCPSEMWSEEVLKELPFRDLERGTAGPLPSVRCRFSASRHVADASETAETSGGGAESNGNSTGSTATCSQASPATPDEDWRHNATLEALVVATKEPREGRPPEGRVNDFTLWNVAHSDALPEARALRTAMFQEASQSLIDSQGPGRAADYLRDSYHKKVACLLRFQGAPRHPAVDESSGWVKSVVVGESLWQVLFRAALMHEPK